MPLRVFNCEQKSHTWSVKANAMSMILGEHALPFKVPDLPKTNLYFLSQLGHF